MGRADLIGNGKQHLIPTFQPLTDGSYQRARRKNSTQAPARPTGKAVPAVGAPRGARGPALGQGAAPAAPVAPVKGRILTQHTGLPPRAGTGVGKPKAGRKGPR